MIFRDAGRLAETGIERLFKMAGVAEPVPTAHSSGIAGGAFHFSVLCCSGRRSGILLAVLEMQ